VALWYMGYCSYLQLFCFLQNTVVVSLLTKMVTMKILVLNSIGPNLDVEVDLLKCFHFLMKLHVIVSIHGCCFNCKNQHCFHTYYLGNNYFATDFISILSIPNFSHKKCMNDI
jgi:hypothetical protein